ncbi:type II CRISPR-associated endonuclease Cas1 [Segnochrobactrum spirostomi]|uniref:CRISPR-associated endonuclease Cas1 n=1 Tax=Segnochrobactrum spirostomi TaxID=2608987 RepID=A0A6A7XYL9_9HYPH|nr:type II CRISPR-associated endonuclease Cas1 [Segnochrobactrum spirostomi]MQT11217.1 type II CRISPR-associated endonuclease Cas1 [Segnochrobactrum spirostomi]
MERIVDIATDGRHLSVHRGFLVVSEGRQEVGRVALDDVAAVIVHAHGVTWTTNLVVALAERGSVLVVCGANHAPVAICLPIEGHHAQNAHYRAQWEAGRPLSKQLWRRVVIAKIQWQAAVLEAHGRDAAAFGMLVRRVGSGDPENVEAQAARRYWPLLMGSAFRRDRAAEGLNGLLNYGYTILRAMVSRAIVAAGLHPSIGIHHANRGNAFALADDLVEPFRPLVDSLSLRLAERGIVALTPDAKRAFAGLTALDLPSERGTTPVYVAAQRLAQSLADCFESGRAADLALPATPSPLELAGLDALLIDPPPLERTT